MANVKISDLPVILGAAVDGATDVLEISDISAGLSKKITPAQLHSAGTDPAVTAADIGTGADKIPLSGMLGNLAFMNSDTVVLTPPAAVVPNLVGDVVFEFTDNTHLTIRAKGSDGTVRAVALVLA